MTSPPGSPPPMPLNWSQWNSQVGYSQFAVTASPPAGLSSTQSLSVTSTGGSGDASRAWSNQTMPADVTVSADVYISTAIPAQLIARGSNLDLPDSSGSGPSFYAVQLVSASPGPQLMLEKDVNGTLTTLASINAPNYVSGAWLQETLDVEGATERAQLFNPATGEYLNSLGQWQSGQAWALTVIDNSISGPGFVGVGRPAEDISGGGDPTGTIYFGNFAVATPATVQSFDATPAGSLPDNWSSWSTRSGDSVAVAAPTSPVTPVSGSNVLAIVAAASTDSARAWLNTSLPADLSVSADAYITATPGQVFARGSNLNSATPTYYAVEVSEGGVFRLVKVVNGVATVLDSVTSTSYIDSIWVQETLGLSGDTLHAQLYRPDTQQYLNSSGDWQSTPTWAFTATDSSITGGGQAGVGRPTATPTYVGTNYFDDFATATGMEAQGFDASTSLPSGWQQSSSNQFSVVAAPSGISPISSPNVLQSTAGSAASQVWDANEELTNAQATAAMYLPSTGAQLFARGTNLGTSTPSYYGLSVAPSDDPDGVDVNLVRVNGGSSTTLASLAPLPNYPTPYVSGLWVQTTLYVDGANVRVQIYRPDTGEYLNSNDQWQPDPTYALNVTDADPLSGAGFAGIARAGGSGPAFYFDNFAVAPLSVDSTPPSVTVSAPSGTQSGTVTITATPTEPVPNYNITQVQFYVDDDNNPVLNYVATGAPYTWSLDTSSLSNGTHTLLVLASDNEGNIGMATTTITVSNNTTLSMPSNFPPYPNNSVGITELDYGTADYTNADSLLQNNVDVVVGADPADLASMHEIAPNVQQLVYTNASNIYDNGFALTSGANNLALTSWLSYAEANGINPEDAFYHVAVATPYSGGSDASTSPVDRFSGVYVKESGNNDNVDMYNGGSLAFGGSTNDEIDIGYLEPYWEINVNLTSGASGGWSYVLEYPTAVNSAGNPTAWATLTTLNDTTAGLTQSGRITFNPPSNWVPASIGGSVPLYYVRVRTVTAGTAPVASTIKGDNYTDSPAGSDRASGVIPAYDWALDPSGGYLDPQQYAIAAAAGYTARFGYQSRLFFDGPMRFYTNPSNPQFQAWALSYYPSLLTSYQYANGLFFDNSGAAPPTENFNNNLEKYNVTNTTDMPIELVETTGSYSTDYATLLNEIGQQIAPDNGWIMANTAASLYLVGKPGQSDADAVISKVQAYWEEGGLIALADNTTQFLTLYNEVSYRANNDDPNYAVIDSRFTNGSEDDPQTQLTTLAAYYILAPNNSSEGALDFFGGEKTSDYWEPSSSPPTYNHWSPAAAYNVGTPENALPSTPAVFTDGTESDGSTYYVYDRQFTGSNGQPVLVLYKPVSLLDGSSSKLSDSESATTVTLGGSYYVLQTNGTLSSTAVTSISLYNGEGAILVSAETDPPQIVGATMIAAAAPTSPASTQSTSGVPSASQGSAGSPPADLFATEMLERLLPGWILSNVAGEGQVPPSPPAGQSELTAVVDRIFSLWTAARSDLDRVFYPWTDAEMRTAFA